MNDSSSSAFTMALALALASTACTSPAPTSTDAGSDATMVDTDATSGSGGDAGSGLFASCTLDTDCPGATASCLTFFPGGMCTIACTTDADCGDAGTCHPTAHHCRPRCASDAYACSRWGASCYDPPTGPARCGPTCMTGDLAPGAPACAPGLACNPWSGACESPTAIPPPGADDGEPCTMAAQCRGLVCLLEYDTSGAATGWIGGACVSYGRMVAQSDYVPGQPFPRSTCPPGSVMPPWMVEAGHTAYCIRSCTASSECRPGYYCSGTDDFGVMNFTVGACLPVDCSVPGRTCPPGYGCDTTGALPQCEALPDGGMTGAADAGVGDAG